MLMKFCHVFAILVLGLLLTQCAHMQSGQFIQIQDSDTLKSISDQYQVTPSAIIKANKNIELKENAPLPVGSWIFIPLKRGVVAHLWDESNDDNDANETPKQWMSKLLWPVPNNYKITSEFGHRNSRPHKGIDIKGYSGDSIVAAHDGIVIYSGNKLRGYGNLTIIYHGDELYTVYAHAQKNYTKKGDKVHRGQVIALVGNTGNSTGTHLHFEVRQGALAVAPMDYLRY